MSCVKIIHFDNQRNSPSKHKTKMEQYAGDSTDLEGLPTIIIKIALRQLIP